MAPRKKLFQLIHWNPGSRCCHAWYIACAGNNRSKPTHSVNVVTRNRLVACPNAVSERLCLIPLLLSTTRSAVVRPQTCPDIFWSKNEIPGLPGSLSSPGRLLPAFRTPDLYWDPRQLHLPQYLGGRGPHGREPCAHRIHSASSGRRKPRKVGMAANLS